MTAKKHPDLDRAEFVALIVAVLRIVRDDLAGDHPQARAKIDALLAELEG